MRDAGEKSLKRGVLLRSNKLCRLRLLQLKKRENAKRQLLRGSSKLPIDASNRSRNVTIM